MVKAVIVYPSFDHCMDKKCRYCHPENCRLLIANVELRNLSEKDLKKLLDLQSWLNGLPEDWSCRGKTVAEQKALLKEGKITPEEAEQLSESWYWLTC